MPISQTEGYFRNPYYPFSEELVLFLLGSKWNLSEKAFFSVKTKSNPNLATIHFSCIWWITFFKHLYSSSVIMECIIELRWLCKHMKNIRTSQPAIAFAELSKTQLFPVSTVKVLFFYIKHLHSNIKPTIRQTYINIDIPGEKTITDKKYKKRAVRYM